MKRVALICLMLAGCHDPNQSARDKTEENILASRGRVFVVRVYRNSDSEFDNKMLVDFVYSSPRKVGNALVDLNGGIPTAGEVWDVQVVGFYGARPTFRFKTKVNQ